MAATKMYVGNLSKNTVVDTLEALFSQAGQVTECTIATDSAGASRGFGFVTMSKDVEARDATARFDGSMLDGRVLKVALATDRPPVG